MCLNKIRPEVTAIDYLNLAIFRVINGWRSGLSNTQSRVIIIIISVRRYLLILGDNIAHALLKSDEMIVGR